MRVAFTAAVSHELRTPLARLLSLLDSISLGAPDVEDLVELGRREVEHMRELIDEMLFLGELDSGREIVSLGNVRVLPVFQEVVSSLSSRAERYGVTIGAFGSEEVTVPVRRRMLAALARNLTENAIRYAGRGATFRLEAAADGDDVVVRAVDDGVGVPAEALPRLFERFYRVDPARSSAGSGLGLAIVKHIVVAARGSVEALHAPGGGLEVRCRIARRRRP
jgi:signal transduction histidine kinase